MSQVTVSQLADVLGVETGKLLAQLNDAGIEAVFELALDQWARLHRDPLCLLRERKEHSRLPELRRAAQPGPIPTRTRTIRSGAARANRALRRSRRRSSPGPARAPASQARPAATARAPVWISSRGSTIAGTSAAAVHATANRTRGAGRPRRTKSATSIASALLKIPVRKNVAMTGEITLRGRVLPIGGLKEKLLAAHRAEINTVLIPKENQKDLKEIPRRVLNALRIVLVEHMDEVLREALVLSDPDALFGEHQMRPAEYRQGELITPDSPDEEDLPDPTVDAPGARQ